jgi:hypothetical protein
MTVSLYASPGWRTYLALHATYMSLADDGLRAQVQDALARAEREHLARVARAWKRTAQLLGFRLRTGSGVTFETLATLIDSAMHGLVMTALTEPEVAAHRVAAQPFGGSETGQWTLPALGLGAIATAFLEPDPEITWNADHTAALQNALTASGLVADGLPASGCGGDGDERLLEVGRHHLDRRGDAGLRQEAGCGRVRPREA